MFWMTVRNIKTNLQYWHWTQVANFIHFEEGVNHLSKYQVNTKKYFYSFISSTNANKPISVNYVKLGVRY